MFYNTNFKGSVTIPDSVTYMGKGVFYYCDGITRVHISNQLTYIQEGTFNNYGIEEVYIPKSVTRISEDAFGTLRKAVIYGYRESYAEEYAKAYGFTFVDVEAPVPTLTPTPTPTATLTATPIPEPTATPTQTPTATPTPPLTPTPTLIPKPTFTPTATPMPDPTASPIPTSTPVRGAEKPINAPIPKQIRAWRLKGGEAAIAWKVVPQASQFEVYRSSKRTEIIKNSRIARAGDALSG